MIDQLGVRPRWRRFLLSGLVVLAACTPSSPASTVAPTASPSSAPTAAPAATPFYTTGSLRQAMNDQYRAEGKKVTIGMCLAQTATTFICTGSSYSPDPYGGADKPTAVTLTVTVGPTGGFIATGAP